MDLKILVSVLVLDVEPQGLVLGSVLDVGPQGLVLGSILTVLDVISFGLGFSFGSFGSWTSRFWSQL